MLVRYWTACVTSITMPFALTLSSASEFLKVGRSKIKCVYKV